MDSPLTTDDAGNSRATICSRAFPSHNELPPATSRKISAPEFNNKHFEPRRARRTRRGTIVGTSSASAISCCLFSTARRFSRETLPNPAIATNRNRPQRYSLRTRAWNEAARRHLRQPHLPIHRFTTPGRQRSDRFRWRKDHSTSSFSKEDVCPRVPLSRTENVSAKSISTQDDCRSTPSDR